MKPPARALLAMVPAVYLSNVELIASPFLSFDIAAAMGHPEKAHWIVVAYLAAAVLSAPICGRLGDRQSYRSTIGLAFGLYGIGALIAAAAPGFEGLLAARFVQGVGGGALVPMAQALIAQSVPLERRPRSQIHVISVIVLAGLIGPLLAGQFAALGLWNGFYLTNALLAAAGLVVSRLLPVQPPAGRAAGLDPVNVGCFAIMLVSLIALAELAKPGSGAMWAWFVPALALGVLGFAISSARSQYPLFPRRLLQTRIATQLVLIVLLNGAISNCLLLLLPLALRTVFDASPAEIGMAILPFTLGVSAGSIITSILLERTGRASAILFGGCGITFAALLVLALRLGDMSAGEFGLLFAVLAPGVGCVMSIAMVVVPESLGPGYFGIASGSMTLSRFLGGAVGLPVISASVGIAASGGVTITGLALSLGIVAMMSAAAAILGALLPGRWEGGPTSGK